MNDWLTLLTVMVDSAAHLPEGSLPGTLTAQNVVEREQQISDDIDATLGALARQQRWPEISQEESFFVNQRLQFGCHIARVLSTPDKSKPIPRPSILPAAPPEFSTDVQLEWLLIDGWNHEGRRAWQERLLAQRRAT